MGRLNNFYTVTITIAKASENVAFSDLITLSPSLSNNNYIYLIYKNISNKVIMNIMEKWIVF